MVLGSDSLIIYRNDSHFNKKNIIGEYSIGVFGFSSCKFQIKISQGLFSIKKLEPGIPDHDSIKSLNMKYYYYESITNTDILISITDIYGKSLVFANTQGLFNDSLYDRLPSASFYTWSSEKSKNSLIIPHNSTEFCMVCNIVIGVFADSDCEYIISAKNQHDFLFLLNGVPFRTNIQAGGWDYYYFEVNNYSNIEILLRTYSGNSDIFVDTEPEIGFFASR